MNTPPPSAFYLLASAAAFVLLAVQPAPAQTQERVVQWPKYPHGRTERIGSTVRTSPVADALEIVEAKVAGHPITIGRPFAAGEDWLKWLTFRLKNISGRPITGVRIHLGLPETQKNGAGVGASLGFGSLAVFNRASDAGKVVWPDEELELRLGDEQHARTKHLVAAKGGPIEIKTVWIGITQVMFEDGALWSGGCLPSRGHGGTCPGATRVGTASGANGAGVTASPRGARRISGTVMMRADGRPVANATILLRSLDLAGGDEAFFESRTLTDEHGRWAAGDVPEGAYLIVADPPPPPGDNAAPGVGTDPGARLSFVPERREVRVAGADINGLVIEVSRGGRVTGGVTMEGGQPLPKDLVVLPERVDVAGVAPIRIHPVRPDGSFTLEGVPTGEIRLRVFVYGKLNQYYAKSAMVNGTNLLREPLLIEDGLEVKGVRVVFSPDVATLSGLILSPRDGSRVAGGQVMLLPFNESRQGDIGERLYGAAMPEGGYTVSGAPGDYLVVVLLPGEDPHTTPEPVIRGRAAKAPHVTLRPGERKKMDVLVPAGK